MYDGEGYYLYLPSTFLYEESGQMPVHTKRSYFANRDDFTRLTTKYAIGPSYVMAPSFFCVWAIRSMTGSPTTGFEGSFAMGVFITVWVFTLLGLWLLYLSLRRHFGQWPSLLTLVVLAIGSNLLFYVTDTPTMSHAFTFVWVSMLVWLTPRLLEAPTTGRWLLLGLVMGMIVVTRPTNVIFVLIPLLWGLGTARTGFKQRLSWLASHWRGLALALVLAFCLLIPQMLYWKSHYGQWLSYSYGGEDFRHWRKPWLLSVLFSYKNGWLVYSPLMILPLIGLGLGWRSTELSKWKWPLLVVPLILWYLCASWHCWFFGGAFGYRSFIDMYPLLALPTAFVLERLLAWKVKWARFALLAVIFWLISLNIAMALKCRGWWHMEGWAGWRKAWTEAMVWNLP